MRKWFPVRQLALLATLVAFLAFGCEEDHAPAARLEIAKVVDGDTIHLVDGTKIRYIGIDTPEKNDKRPEVREMAKRATEANRFLLSNGPIRLEFDVSDTDRYGRVLAYVYSGDVFVNAELVRLGYASAYTYPPDVRYSELFVSLEQEARENRRGLWSSGNLDDATR